MVSTVQKSYRKNILREMKSSISRVVSLFGIVALGVMMLTGLMCIAPDMRTAAQKYYVQQNVFDLRVLSTLGLSESDLSAIAATEGVSAVMPVKYLDTEGRWSSSTDGAVLRVQQLPADPAADTEANMNRLTLLEGRMPETANECVVQVLGHADPVPLGTVVTLPEDTEDIRRTEYTVVGQVQDPQYFSATQETSTVGDGILDALVFVQDGELTADYYTVCYLKVADAAQYDNYSDEYQTAVDTVADRLDAISKEHCVARRAQLIEDATTQLDDAKQTYSEQKAEAERQFAQAEQKLTDAQRELDAAKAHLKDDRAELLEALYRKAVDIHEDDIAKCTAISEYGLSLLKDGDGVLTHCNAGPLATSRYGTGQGPFLLAAERGIHIRVFADETRPLLQGARLTSYELQRAGVDVTLICDNMASMVMKNGWVQACFVGCDRIAANGDFANKIGTSGVAILAKHYGIPVYTLGPTSTIDMNCPDGAHIPIELRDGDEIKNLWYEKPMALPEVKCFNPSFDVTDHELLTGIVTEKGICYPPFTESLAALFKDKK